MHAFFTSIKVHKRRKLTFYTCKNILYFPRSMDQLLYKLSCIAKEGSNVLLNKSKKCKNYVLCGKYGNYTNMIDEIIYTKTDEN